jgi:hypothetical protein
MSTSVKKEDVTEEDLELLGALKELEGFTLKEKLERFVKRHEESKEAPMPSHFSHVTGAADKRPVPIPRISRFFGEDSKGEVTYLTWRYEIQCLMEEGSYPEDVLLLAIRNSAKGEAGEIMRRLGVGTPIAEVLAKFHSTYGQIDPPEIVLRKFYACEQGATESFTRYAARVEELFAQAVELGALRKNQDKVLMSVLYQGIRQPLKQMANYAFQTGRDYDRFKIEVRKHESELEISPNPTPTPTPRDKDKATTKCQAMHEAKSDTREIKDLLKVMNDRIKKLEEDKEQQQQQQQQQTQLLLQQQAQQILLQQQQYFHPRGRRGQRHHRGNRGRGDNRGRGTYIPERPTGTTTMTPSEPTNQSTDYNYNIRCFRCNKQGHIARYCRENI